MPRYTVTSRARGAFPELLLEYAGTLSTFGLMRAALDMASVQ